MLVHLQIGGFLISFLFKDLRKEIYNSHPLRATLTPSFTPLLEGSSSTSHQLVGWTPSWKLGCNFQTSLFRYSPYTPNLMREHLPSCYPDRGTRRASNPLSATGVTRVACSRISVLSLTSPYTPNLMPLSFSFFLLHQTKAS